MAKSIYYFALCKRLSGQAAKRLAVLLTGATSISVCPIPGYLGRLLSPVTTIQGKNVLHKEFLLVEDHLP